MVLSPPMTKASKLECQTCNSRLLGVLCDLEKNAVEECDQHKTTNEYKKGQVIFYEGNQAYGLYCIFSGRVKLYQTGVDGRQQILRIAGPGDLLGYRALFSDESYHATAETLEASVICCVDKNAFFPVLAKNPKLALNIIKKLAKELREAEELATSIAQRSVRERMAELLMMLKETYGKPSKKGIVIDLHLSREELAEMIGITQETAIRLLSEFKKDGLIEVHEREITILNPKALLETARIEA
ncbi:MAG: Crp/Fnr family transcriptional regulator [Deltaproteobacteria bacterium]|nr:Crp/Fnr family transcriptional regulator [Deltaproteobacteria bacterium]